MSFHKAMVECHGGSDWEETGFNIDWASPPTSKAPALVPYECGKELLFSFIQFTSSTLFSDTKKMPNLQEFFKTGALIPAIPISFSDADSRPPAGSEFPALWLRVAPILRIIISKSPCNGDTNSTCECDGWYKWRKGWAQSRCATDILKTFIGKERDHTKKIQLQASPCSVQTEGEFRPQLTFLSLLAEEEDLRFSLPAIDLLQPNGKRKRALHVDWRQALMRTREILDLQGEKHHCTNFFVDLDADGLVLIMKRKKSDDVYFRIRHEPAWSILDTPGGPVYVLMRGSGSQPGRALKPLMKCVFESENCSCCGGRMTVQEEPLWGDLEMVVSSRDLRVVGLLWDPLLYCVSLEER
ncbi:hypothetical protein MMC10_001757 [Thelotrema lepadinum]|nr:hypothetical protein [Thelotrema lepadinum]